MTSKMLQQFLLLDARVNFLYDRGQQVIEWRSPKQSVVVFLVVCTALSRPRIALTGMIALIVWKCIGGFEKSDAQEDTKIDYMQIPRTVSFKLISQTTRLAECLPSAGSPRIIRGSSKAFPPGHFVLWAVLFAVQLSGICEMLTIAAVLLLFGCSDVFGAKSLIDYAVNVSKVSCIIGAHRSMQAKGGSIDFFHWKTAGVLEWRVESLFENQRWWAGLGWTTEMLHEDPGSWSDELGTLSTSSAIAYEELTSCKYAVSEGWNVGNGACAIFKLS